MPERAESGELADDGVEGGERRESGRNGDDRLPASGEQAW
jgi:hypothetical protein